MKYGPLYIKTNNSLLSSLIKLDELMQISLKYGFKSLTITDNNMFGVMDFYKICQINHIKPIIGLEVTIDNFKIVLYCLDLNGYHNLCLLSTIASERSLTIDDLKGHHQGLLSIIPFASLALFDQLVNLYQHCFQSYQSINERNQLVGSNLVYMRETLYLDPSDIQYINYLSAIKDGLTIDSIVANNEDHYLKSFDEVSKDYPMDLENNYLINELCQVEIKTQPDLLPVYECPKQMDSYQYLKELCKEGLKRLFGTTVNKIYVERLKFELDVINKMGFCNYFLVVWDYVKYAKDQGILVGPGRGSAAGSLVSYCLNITDVDPIQYNLLFERFLNPERISMPDIDIDFEDSRREEVINYCVNKYGLKKVVGIITFGTLGSKQVIRDVGRVCQTDLKVVDYLCRMLDSRESLLVNYNHNQKLKDYLNNDEDLMKLYKIALKFEGLKRHTSIHAAGIIMGSTDLDNIIPLHKNREGFYTTAYSMEYLEDLGLLKMDFLGLRNLTLISDVIKSINDPSLTFETIPVNDPKAFQIFESVNTLGIFQFESSGMMNFLRKFKPNNFEEIAAAVALFRPGPMNNIDIYIKRKRGLDKIEYYHPNLKTILEPTYGVIIYQEQIMQIASVMAGYSLGEADVLRRAMSKKKEEILIKERDKFISRSLELGYDKSISEQVYDLILKFAAYGFNRAHSVAYAMIAYKMAYLKANYQSYFMKSLLSMAIGSDLKTKEYIYECKLNNITILKPDINLSNHEYKIEEFGIRYPLTNIKNVGASAIKTIMSARDLKKFTDIFDFVKRTYGKSINRKTLESLIDAGCFTSFELNKQTLYHNLDLLINYAEIMENMDEGTIEKPELIITGEFPKKELMQKELDLFGFYLSNHPVTEYRLRYPKTISLNDLDQYYDTFVEVIVYLDRLKEIETKKKDKMLFITGSDELKTIDLVLFPTIYQSHQDLQVSDVVLVKAKVEKRFDKLQLVVNEINKIN